MHSIKYAVLIVVMMGVSACAPNIGANNYTAGQAQKVSEVSNGVIVSESQVEVEGSKDNWAGTLIGAAAGAVVGSTVGHGAGTGLAMVGGAAAGGYAGNKAEGALSKQTATRYVIKLTNGNTVAVVQADNPPIPVGTKVQVISGNPAQVVVSSGN